MKKAYWLAAQRRKNEEGCLAYSSQNGFSAQYLQRSHKSICSAEALQAARQWDLHQTLPKSDRESLRKMLFNLPINFFVLQKLLKSAPNRSDGSLGFFNEYGHSMSIFRESDGFLIIDSADFDPNCDSGEGGHHCFTGTLDDPIDLFEKSKEACDDSFLRQFGSQWDRMLKELIARLFGLPDHREISAFELTLPRGEKRIADRAFYCASSVSRTIVPHGVIHIGKMAFAGCTNLSEITLPATLKTMGGCAFAYCRSLQSIVIPEGVEIIPDSAFKRCSSLRSVTLPRSLRHISDSAFEGCTSLEQITLPEGILSIGSNAFASCIRLRSVNIPSRIAVIENGTFFACHMLESIRLPEGIRSIGCLAFAGSALRSISVPDGVREITDSAFQSCTKLESVTLPSCAESIAEHAFCGTALRTVCLPHGITRIGREAFSRCPDLTEVILPDSVMHIAGGLFRNCRSLYSVTLSNALPSIPEDTFENCSGISHIIAPIGKIPSCNQEAACIGFARSPSLYPQAFHEEYLSFIRTHINTLWYTALKEMMLLRLICCEKLIDRTHFSMLLDESICRNEIEMTSLLLEYRQAHPDIFSDDSDDSLSLD